MGTCFSFLNVNRDATDSIVQTQAFSFSNPLYDLDHGERWDTLYVRPESDITEQEIDPELHTI